MQHDFCTNLQTTHCPLKDTCLDCSFWCYWCQHLLKRIELWSILQFWDPETCQVLIFFAEFFGRNICRLPPVPKADSRNQFVVLLQGCQTRPSLSSNLKFKVKLKKLFSRNLGIIFISDAIFFLNLSFVKVFFRWTLNGFLFGGLRVRRFQIKKKLSWPSKWSSRSLFLLSESYLVNLGLFYLE